MQIERCRAAAVAAAIAFAPPFAPPFAGSHADYALGDVLRSPYHMIIEPTVERAIASVGLLKPHDFAFLKRSDGSYTYAVLASRSWDDNGEELLTFVVSGDGATKTAREGRWPECVRPVR